MNVFSGMFALQLGVTMLALLPAFASAQSSAPSTTARGPQDLRTVIAALTLTIKGNSTRRSPVPVEHRASWAT